MDFMNREKMTEVITESPTMSKADKLREAVSRNRQANLEGFKPIDDKSKPVRTVKDVLDVIKRYVPQGGGGGGGGGGGYPFDIKQSGGSVPPSALLVKDEGLQVVAAAASMNFVGDLVTVTESPVGEARVQVRGPAIFDSPAPGVQGVQIKSSATILELGPNLFKQTFGTNGRVYIDAIPGGGGGSGLNFFADSRIDADGNSVTGLNVLTPGLEPVLSFNMSSPNSAFAVTGGDGLSYASVDIGVGAVQITPGALSPDHARGAFSVAIGAKDTSGTPAETNAIAEIAIGGTTNGNGGAVAIGLSSSSGGGVGQTGNDGAVALGQSSSANFRRSVSVGRSAISTDIEATAVGNAAISAGFGVAVGTVSNASVQGTAVGAGTSAGINAVSVGLGAISSQSGIAIGASSNAGLDAIAIGAGVVGGQDSATVVGTGAAALGQAAAVLGVNSEANTSSVSVGPSANSGSRGISIGAAATSLDFQSIAIGAQSLAQGPLTDLVVREGSVSLGCGAVSPGVKNVILGPNASADVGVENSVALGYNAVVPASNQIQLGNSAQTTYVFGTVQDRSDARDKAEVRDTELGLNFIMSLRPVDYKWDYREDYFTLEEVVGENGEISYNKVPVQKDGSKVRTRFHHGFIAQEVGSSGFEFGGHQDHSIKNPGVDIQSLGYAEFIAPLVKAVQEQQKIIEELKAEIAAMKAA